VLQAARNVPLTEFALHGQGNLVQLHVFAVDGAEPAQLGLAVAVVDDRHLLARVGLRLRDGRAQIDDHQRDEAQHAEREEAEHRPPEDLEEETVLLLGAAPLGAAAIAAAVRTPAGRARPTRSVARSPDRGVAVAVRRRHILICHR
jgi:hypothetical protein